jgi:agmatinase
LYRAYHQRFNDLSVLQLDAHSDLRYEYEDSIYSHASVMRRIYELNRNIVQAGIRSQCVEEAQFIKSERIRTFYAHRLRESGFGTELIEALSSNVYLTIDVDFLDPSIMPATGTPEPGGFLWYETIRFLRRVFAERNVVGLDVVELSPLPGLAHPDFLTAKLIYKLIGMKQAARSRKKG